GAGSERADPAARYRDRSGCSLRRRFAGRGAKGRQSSRPASRNPDSSQGQRRYRRPNDDDCGIVSACGIDSVAGLVYRSEAESGGRGFSGESESQRVGELQVIALDEWLERTRGTREESVRARPQRMRIKLWIWWSGLGK